MSTPKNHHFIPRVYLKEFANSKLRLFQAVKGHSNISPKTIAQVCYKADYFKLSTLEGDLPSEIRDPNHIEIHTFQRQENAYTSLLKKLTHSAISFFIVDRIDVVNFLETLMTFKRRGPIYRKETIEWYKEYVQSEKFRKLVEEGLHPASDIGGIDTQQLFKDFVEEHTTSADKQSDMYLKGFIDKENTISRDVAGHLMQFKVIMFHAPFGSQFITSDNPGYTQFINNQVVSYGGYSLLFRFFYPLTPKHCLHIDYSEHDHPRDPSSKVIYVQHVTKESVDLINENTYKMAIDKVFSYEMESLAKVLSK